LVSERKVRSDTILGFGWKKSNVSPLKIYE